MRRLTLAASVLLAAASAARADVQNGYLLTSDYGASVLDKFSYSYDTTTGAITFAPAGATSGSAVFLGNPSSAPVKEGIQGTNNDIILVGGSHGSGVTNFSRYSIGGTFLGTIPVDFSGYNGGNVGIGNVVATPDGQYLYAPLESAGQVVKISLATGAIVANYAYSGAHDVVILPNGNILVANYNASGAGIVELNSSLQKVGTGPVISANPNGVSGSFRPTGMTYDAVHNALIVNGNQRGVPNSVLYYSLSGATGSTGTQVTATFDSSRSYIGSAQNNLLQFIFGSSLAPNGHIYIAALGGGGSGSFSVTNGYQDGIYDYDPATGKVTLAIAGYTEKTGPAGLGGFIAPKYLQFDFDFIPANDPGLPEPSSFALLGAAAGIFGMIRRRRAV